MKNIKPTRFDVYIETASERARVTIRVTRESVAAETLMISFSFMTRGAIPSIAATVIAANGFISSISRTRPKSSP